MKPNWIIIIAIAIIGFLLYTVLTGSQANADLRVAQVLAEQDIAGLHASTAQLENSITLNEK